MSDVRLRAAEQRAKLSLDPEDWHRYVRAVERSGGDGQAAWRELIGIAPRDLFTIAHPKTGTVHIVSAWAREHKAGESWSPAFTLCGTDPIEGPTWADCEWRTRDESWCKTCEKSRLSQQAYYRAVARLQGIQAKRSGQLPFLCRINSHKRLSQRRSKDGRYLLSKPYLDHEPAPCEDCGVELPPVDKQGLVLSPTESG